MVYLAIKWVDLSRDRRVDFFPENFSGLGPGALSWSPRSRPGYHQLHAELRPTNPARLGGSNGYDPLVGGDWNMFDFP